jgi:hypothetical protein
MNEESLIDELLADRSALEKLALQSTYSLPED